MLRILWPITNSDDSYYPKMVTGYQLVRKILEVINKKVDVDFSIFF